MSYPTQAELVSAARSGETRALNQIVRENHGKVFGCAMKMLKDEAAAEDAAQETFIRAWRALDRFDGRSGLSTWLYRICVNVCLTRIRTRKRRQSKEVELRQSRISILTDPEHPEAGPEESVAGFQLQARLEMALEELPETLRMTVILVLIQGLPHHEAADVLGCSAGTIAWRVHEARRRLRRKLRDVLEAGDGRGLAWVRGTS